MLLHYLKIAWRNLLKYKTQNVISILGLAIGFTAFSFAMSWIRYEMGYDSHNPDADRIYRVVKVNKTEIGGVDKMTPEPLPYYLESTFPEIEAATTAETTKNAYYYNSARDSIPDCYMLRADPSFFQVFYPEIVPHFPDPLPDNYLFLVSEKIMKKLSERGAGDELMHDERYLGTIPNKSYHSNVAFDFIDIKGRHVLQEGDCSWCGYSAATYIRVREGADVRQLERKLEHIEVEGSMQGVMSYKLIPLRKVHYTLPDEMVNIRFNHLRIFSLVSLLIILCALFNYLMLFANRVKMRSRELALRKVNAASNYQLLCLLSTEYLFILFFSIFTGMLFSELLFRQFIRFSMIDAPKSFFISEIFLYGGFIIIVSVLILWFPLQILLKRTIRKNIQVESTVFKRIKIRFSEVSLSLQIIICVLFIFCSFIFLYQYNFLNRADIGFSRHNVNSMFNHEKKFQVSEILSIPGVEDVLIFPGGMLPRSYRSNIRIDQFDGQKLSKEISFEIFSADFPKFISFFDIRILEGRNIREGETRMCLINQSAAKVLGTGNLLGKQLNSWTIVGIIPDLYIDSPLLPVFPSLYTSIMDQSPENNSSEGSSFVYKFTPGSRRSTEKAIEKLAEEKGIINGVRLSNMDEVYAEYTQSERYLLILLMIMTAVSVLIAVFGVYSMITLSCGKRRKEVAIRKVNGARAKELLWLFFSQYLKIVFFACLVAFPAGVLVMQHWLEQYTRRVSMEWWIFVGIILLIGGIVSVTVFFRIYHTTKENPADVVKSE